MVNQSWAGNPDKCFNKRYKLCSQSQLLSVCSSCSCYDKCCLNSKSSNNVAQKLSPKMFKSNKRSDSAHMSSEAKIQTGMQSQSSREACILKSCDSCTFCSYRRHVFQGSVASRKRHFPATVCMRCFFCKSVRFCSGCCNLGLYGSQSMGGIHFKEWLCPPFSDKASSHPGTVDSEWICDSRQAGPFAGVSLVSTSKTSH